MLGLHDGARALSRLTRDYTIEVQPARGSIDIDDGLLEGLLAGSQPLLGFQSGFHARQLPVQLSFPKAAVRWT